MDKSPEDKASVLSILSLSWITPLFHLGYNQTLEQRDLYQLPERFHVSKLADAFEDLWKEKERPLAVSILKRLFALRFYPMGGLKLINDVSIATSPLLIQRILIYISSKNSENPHPISEGIIYSLVLFVVTMISSISISQFFQKVNGIGMTVRGVLTACIYRKALRLSAKSRNRFDSGKITNMISSDCVRIDNYIMFIHLTWTYALQLFIIFGLLISILGYAAFAGIILLLVMVPLQILVVSWLIKIRKSNAIMTDSRIKLIQELFQGIKIIKMFAWENPFLKKVAEIRDFEFNAVKKSNYIRSAVVAMGFTLPTLAASISFVVYGFYNPNISPAVIFTSMALFNQLRNLIMWSPMILSLYADAKIAISRIQLFLEAEELTFNPIFQKDSESAIQINNGNFSWIKNDESFEQINSLNVDKSSFQSSNQNATSNDIELIKSIPVTLKNVNISFPKGSLCIIVGSIGSGKSSLLQAIIGQMYGTNESKIIYNGSLGYCPQQAWILNATARENILFGRPYNKVLYNKIIKACALERDFEILPGGDLAEIGERGINLSGGQKQRISLARLAYFDSDIVLLDDPFSAVDAEVGAHLFKNCIKNILSGKTIILVTHQLQFVRKSDMVVVMKNESIVEYGHPETLLKQEGELFKIMNGFLDYRKELSNDDAVLSNSSLFEFKRDVTETKLILNEERMIGAINGGILKSYLKAAGGTSYLVLFLLILFLMQAARIATDLWLTYWTQKSVPNLNQSEYIGIYGGLAVTQTIFTIIFAMLVARGGTQGAKNLHNNAINNIMYAPISFFDTTPLGRIINRFSRDQDQVDNTLTDALRLFLLTFATTISTFILVIVITNGYFLIPLVPMTLGYYYLQNIYRITSRELKRLDSLSRSPLYAHISESIIGVATIRAYNEDKKFILKTEQLIDINNRPYYLQTTAQRWLGLRLEVLGNLLLLSVSLFGVFQSFVSESIIGLSLTYILQVSSVLNLCVRQFAETEVQLNAVERLNYYAADIQTEAKGGKSPHAIWPSKGDIEFKEVDVRYQSHLPLVLKNVTINIRAREKIGVVGRTGSGKSSLMLAIFRLVEISSGQILIDGQDINHLELFGLRSKISIIPQDPVLFSGTIRSNLDPFNENSDEELWSCLDRSSLKETVMKMDGKLDSAIFSGGENLSVGQRQLFCLARAIVRVSKIVILDECTANVDAITDIFIQKCLRSDFKDCTVLTIAHRLNTIIDYDRIIVLEEGSVAEFDSPSNLMNDSNSIFYRMLQESRK